MVIPTIAISTPYSRKSAGSKRYTHAIIDTYTILSASESNRAPKVDSCLSQRAMIPSTQSVSQRNPQNSANGNRYSSSASQNSSGTQRMRSSVMRFGQSMSASGNCCQNPFAAGC